MSYTRIAEAGNALVELLRHHLVPDVVKNPEHIGLVHPKDRGEYRVGVWLYDISECGELQSHSMITIDSRRQKYPSCYVRLFYMITAFSGSDVRYRAAEEHEILGKVIQVLKEYAVLEGLCGSSEEEMRCMISLQNMSTEDKMHIFNMRDEEYRTSLFYELGPVEIESVKLRDVTRVVSTGFEAIDKREK